jgi:hypothetical protein
VRDEARLDAHEERVAGALLAELRHELAGRHAQEEREQRQREEGEHECERPDEDDAEGAAHVGGRKPAARSASFPSSPSRRPTYARPASDGGSTSAA